jgi:phospholipid/cholesterol/gamma-HCH transport system ATP-binding protein
MSTAPAPKIAVRGLEKSFGRKRVLDGVEIDVGAGESLVIIGGSGTGKSVLIKCLLGLMRPDSGSMAKRPQGSAAPRALG